MATIASIWVSINANTAKFVQGMKTAEGALGGFRAKLNQIGSGGFLGPMLAQASAFGKVGRALVGGGALAGVSSLARSFENLAESVNASIVAFRAGDAGLGDLIGNAARAVPVLGSLTQMFDEILHGREKLEIAQQNQKSTASIAAQDLASRFAGDAKRVGVSGPALERLNAAERLSKKLVEIRDLQTQVDTAGGAALSKAASLAKQEFDKTIAAINIDQSRAALRAFGEQFKSAVGAGMGFFARMGDRAKDSATKIGAFFEEMKADAKSFTESTRTPGERFQQEMDRLNRVSALGLISEETATRAAKQLRDALNSELQDLQPNVRPIIGEARAINLSRTFVPGISGPGGVGSRGAMVRDPQLIETNKRLAEIAKNTAKNATATVGP